MGKDFDIIQAVKDNDHAALQKLLQKASKQTKNKIIGNSKKLNVNFQDTDGMSALHQAALMSSAQMLQTLLDSGASSTLKDNKGMTALHYAAWQGVSQPVHILLHSGSPVNEQSLSGDTPLHLAAQHGHYDVTTLLLNQHADPTIYNKDLRTSLDLACQFGRNRVVELLLRSNLCQKLLEDSPTDTLDNSRTTCLHLAARNGHVEIIKLLLQAGMNINRSTLKGTCLHEAAMAGKIDVVRLLLDCGVDVNKPNSYDQTALDIIQKFANGLSGKELKDLLKEASCAVYARAIKDYSNVYDPGSLAFREGNIITVLEQRTDGIWRGYVYHEGRMAKIGMFPANNVVLIDSKVVARQQQQQQKPVQMYGQVPDLLSRGPSYGSSLGTVNHHYSSSDRGSLESSSTDDNQPATSHSFPSTPSSNFPPPPSSMLSSYSQRGPLMRDPSNADSGFSSSQSLPQYTPSSPAAPQQFGKPAFTFGQSVNANDNILQPNNGNISEYQHHYHLHQQHNGEWSPAPTSLPVLGGLGGDMRGSSPAKDSPGHSNRNSAASSDSGRGCSTGHSEVKPVHSYVNVHVNNQQHRLSGQSYESGVSSRQSYHSSSSSSLGSLDRLEESGFTSTINVAQLLQAGVPDSEVLHAWLHDLHFEDYFPLFIQAGYDMPTVSRMTPEDLTAVGITKPAHRKRLKSEIARLNISDGIPDFRPNDLMEWLHLLGLGVYLDTLCGQGYDSIDYVTDIMWEDLEEIGIQKLGHQKKIMLAIDRLKRITSGVKHLPSVDGRTASLELLEPPPPAPPITSRWSGGEITAVPPHVYDGIMLGVKPKKSPSGDSISTTSSGNSGSSVGSGTGGEIRVIPLPRDDVGLAGAVPYRHNSTGSVSGLQPDVVSMQGKKIMKSNFSEDRKDINGPQIMYQYSHNSSRRSSDNDVFLENPRNFDTESNSIYAVASAIMMDKHRPIARVMAKSQTEKHEHENNADGNKIISNAYPLKGFTNNNNNSVGLQIGEHIYDTPQLSPSHKSLKPSVMVKPASPFDSGIVGHINTAIDLSKSGQSTPLAAGGKGGKKIPPPPPIRTHSIRGESSSDSAPNSPSRIPIAPTTITVSASVHPQPVAITTAKQPPPPVMQKPQKPMPSAVITKLQVQNNQQPLNPTIIQKPQSPKPIQSQKVATAPSVHPLQHSSVSGQGTEQPQVFSTVIAIQQHQTQPKSPLPIKLSQAPIVSISPQQQHLPQSEPLSQSRQNTGSTTQPLGIHLQQKSKAVVLPSQHFGAHSPSYQGHQQQPQVQAFASCMKNLSEKVGKRTQEDDQFPDNVSTDSDEFPPPPPPIAMDIITPKIHNYGIPSPRDRGKPDYGLQHQREYTQKSNANPPATRNVAPISGIPQDLSHKNLSKPSGQNIESTMVVGPTKTMPEHFSGVQLRKQPQMSSTSSSPSNSDHEHTPEPDPMSIISNEKRSESTTSFESSSSTSSIDSNTLPFANENVGTIKQRAANVKPSIVQSINMEDGHKSINLNQNLFESDAHRITAGYSKTPSIHLSPFSHHSGSEAAKSSMYSPDAQSHQLKHQHQISNPSSLPPSSGAVPSLQPNKESICLKPRQPAETLSPSLQSQKTEQVVTAAGNQPEACNVLSDIDDMLQDLTDELDAMLEEEMAS